MMDHDDDAFLTGEGCTLHGDEYMRECTMCGVEFCCRCHPNSLVCEDCAEGDDDAHLDPDYEDLSDIEDLMTDDEEVEKLLRESEEIDFNDEDEDDDGFHAAEEDE
jgi:hypothetical protein